jgi:RHS repeat-associated protein
MLVDRTSDGPVAAGNDEKLFCNTDRRFSITALTNLAGGVVERYAYSPYGEIAVFDGAGVLRTDGTTSYGLSVAYTGRKLDRESGLYFFRARYHDPRLGRFTTRDPLFYPDGPNAYAAWMGVGDVDPIGQTSTDPLFGINNPDFWDWWHQEKTFLGYPPDWVFPNAEEARNAEQDWISQGRPRGKGGKSGKGGRFRSGRRGGRSGPGSTGTGIIAGGATIGYEEYVAAGEELGNGLVTRIGLCRQLQLALDPSAEGAFARRTRFDYSPKGQSTSYQVLLIKSNGRCWITVSHQETTRPFVLFFDQITESIDDIVIGDCPLESRCPDRDCR